MMHRAIIRESKSKKRITTTKWFNSIPKTINAVMNYEKKYYKNSNVEIQYAIESIQEVKYN